LETFGEEANQGSTPELAQNPPTSGGDLRSNMPPPDKLNLSDFLVNQKKVS
jgi:hypothetical protein